MSIKKGDIVRFKSMYTIGLDDLIRRQTFSKYMIVIDVIHSVKEKPACKVMCTSGEINWVAMTRLDKV